MEETALASSGPPDGRAEDNPLVTAFFEKRESLLLFLAARTRCMATAEDLVQDLYLKIATVDPGAEVKAPVALLSTSPKREDTILVHDPFVD